MSNRYDVHTDEVIVALIAEAVSDSDVIGLVLTGSRAVGDVTSESDYDAIFVVTNEAMARYEQPQTMPSLSTGNPRRPQLLARWVVTLLHERGFGHIYDAWDGQIDQALSWGFSE